MIREEAKQRFESLGGRVISIASKQADYVMAGKDPGSKLQKVNTLGIQVLDEQAWKAFLTDIALSLI